MNINARLAKLEADTHKNSVADRRWVRLVRNEAESLEDAKARWLKQHPGETLDGANVIVHVIVSPPPNPVRLRTVPTPRTKSIYEHSAAPNQAGG